MASPINVDSVSDMLILPYPDSGDIYYVTDPATEGMFLFTAGDTTLGNGGTIFQATGMVSGTYRRIFSGPVNVRWFGAIPDAVITNLTPPYITVTSYVTDNRAAIQAAITFMLGQPGLTGGTLYFPAGNYYIGGTSILVNLLGPSYKPYALSLVGEIANNRITWEGGTGGNDYGGTIIVKDTVGDMFKVNLDASDVSVLPNTSQWINFSVSNMAFMAASSNDDLPAPPSLINAFKMFRTRCTMQNLSGNLLNYLVFQPATDAASNSNYCDQSIYKNIYLSNPMVGGLYLFGADASLLENVNCEQPFPQLTFNNVISIFSSDAVAIRNMVSWMPDPSSDPVHDPTQTVTATTNSTLILIKNSTNTIISSIHMEHLLNVYAGITIDSSQSTRCEGIHARFHGSDTVKLISASGVVIDGMDVAKTNIATYYDIDFADTNSLNVVWSNIHLQESPYYTTPYLNRIISINSIVPAPPLLPPATPPYGQSVYYDKFAVAQNYADCCALPGQVIRLPTPDPTQITSNLTVILPNATNFPGSRIVIWNQTATSSSLTWQFRVTGTGIPSVVKNSAGSDVSTIPQRTVTVLIAYGTANWLLESQSYI